MSNKIEGEELLTQDDYEKAGATIAEPKAEKKPSNAGLTVALVAFNFAFVFVDILSAVVVGYLTRWYYGLASLLAGAVFMGVHEFLFTRAFNNARQRNIAIGGAVWAVLTILVIALLSVTANLTGFMSAQWEPYFLAVMVVVIVANVVLHGTLTAIYYYIDDGHNAVSKTARAVARAKTQVEIDDAAEILLNKAIERRIARKKMVRRFRSPSAVRKAIEEAGGDADGDGIPDFMDPIDNRTGKAFVYAQTAGRTPVQMPTVAPQKPANASDQQQGTSYTLKDLQAASGKTPGQIRAEFVDYPQFAAWCSGQFDHISGGNMKRIWNELNPTRAGGR